MQSSECHILGTIYTYTTKPSGYHLYIHVIAHTKFHTGSFNCYLQPSYEGVYIKRKLFNLHLKIYIEEKNNSEQGIFKHY